MDEEQVERLILAVGDIHDGLPDPERWDAMVKLLVRIADAVEQIAIEMPRWDAEG